jgi:hypothetical protein
VGAVCFAWGHAWGYGFFEGQNFATVSPVTKWGMQVLIPAKHTLCGGRQRADISVVIKQSLVHTLELRMVGQVDLLMRNVKTLQKVPHSRLQTH